MSKPIISDVELWERIVLNDERALSTLFDRYSYRLYTIAQRYLADNEISEEIVHDIFLDLWKRRDSLQIESFRSFLSTAVKYQVYKKIRAKKNVPLKLVDDTSALDNSFINNDAEEKLAFSELEQQLNQHLQALPKRCREIFLMSRVEHLSNVEIAERLNISKRTVENQITHATKHLKIVFKNLAVVVLAMLLSKYS